jgi:hypothetical protein
MQPPRARASQIAILFIAAFALACSSATTNTDGAVTATPEARMRAAAALVRNTAVWCSPGCQEVIDRGNRCTAEITAIGPNNIEACVQAQCATEMPCVGPGRHNYPNLDCFIECVLREPPDVQARQATAMECELAPSACR